MGESTTVIPTEKELFMKELELIENIINRMASNSFLIKGWTVSLVLIAMLLSPNTINKLLSLFPCIVFWYLDSYFLRLERCYRTLYNWVVENRPHTNEYFFNLNAKNRFSSEVDSIPNIMFSSSISPFYVVIILLIIFITILLLVNG